MHSDVEEEKEREGREDVVERRDVKDDALEDTAGLLCTPLLLCRIANDKVVLTCTVRMNKAAMNFIVVPLKCLPECNSCLQ